MVNAVIWSQVMFLEVSTSTPACNLSLPVPLPLSQVPQWGTHLAQTYKTQQYLKSAEEHSATNSGAHFLAGSLNTT